MPNAATLALGSCAPAIEATREAPSAARIEVAKDERILVVPRAEGADLQDESIRDQDRLTRRHRNGRGARGNGPADRERGRQRLIRVRRIGLTAEDVLHL